MLFYFFYKIPFKYTLIQTRVDQLPKITRWSMLWTTIYFNPNVKANQFSRIHDSYKYMYICILVLKKWYWEKTVIGHSGINVKIHISSIHQETIYTFKITSTHSIQCIFAGFSFYVQMVAFCCRYCMYHFNCIRRSTG